MTDTKLEPTLGELQQQVSALFTSRLMTFHAAEDASSRPETVYEAEWIVGNPKSRSPDHLRYETGEWTYEGVVAHSGMSLPDVLRDALKYEESYNEQVKRAGNGTTIKTLRAALSVLEKSGEKSGD